MVRCIITWLGGWRCQAFFVVMGWGERYTRTSGTPVLGGVGVPRPELSLLSRGLKADAYLRHAMVFAWCVGCLETV